MFILFSYGNALRRPGKVPPCIGMSMAICRAEAKLKDRGDRGIHEAKTKHAQHMVRRGKRRGTSLSFRHTLW